MSKSYIHCISVKNYGSWMRLALHSISGVGNFGFVRYPRFGV